MKNVCKNIKVLLPSLKPLKAPANLSKKKQEEMLYKMCAIRAFDSRVKDLWMDSEIYGLAHAYIGAEAIAVGACEAINKEDYISSTHRGHGHTLAKGADVKAMMYSIMKSTLD